MDFLLLFGTPSGRVSEETVVYCAERKVSSSRTLWLTISQKSLCYYCVIVMVEVNIRCADAKRVNGSF